MKEISSNLMFVTQLLAAPSMLLLTSTDLGKVLWLRALLALIWGGSGVLMIILARSTPRRKIFVGIGCFHAAMAVACFTVMSIPGFIDNQLSAAVLSAFGILSLVAVYLLGIRRPWPLIIAVWLGAFALFVSVVGQSPFIGAFAAMPFFLAPGLGFLAMPLWVRSRWPFYTATSLILFGLGLPCSAVIRWFFIPTLLVFMWIFFWIEKRSMKANTP